MHTLNTVVLATDWSTGIMAWIANIMKLVAVFVVLGAAVKSIKDFTGGKIGNGAKTIIGAVVVVTFLWNPGLIDRIIDLGASITDKGITTIDETTKDGTGADLVPAPADSKG